MLLNVHNQYENVAIKSCSKYRDISRFFPVDLILLRTIVDVVVDDNPAIALGWATSSYMPQNERLAGGLRIVHCDPL